MKAERAWIVTASGGTPIGSELDFNTSYLRTILHFIGISDIRVVAAEGVQSEGDAAVARALAEMEHLLSDAPT